MRYNLYFILLTFVFNIQYSNAQIPDTAWTKTYGGAAWDNAYSVQPTSDGGYILTGFTESFGNGTRDLWLIKTGANGDTSWTKTYGGLGQESGYGVLQTADGYILAGQTDSYGEGSFDIYILKLTSSGDIVWTKTYGDVNADYARDIKMTSDGGYIICGSTSGDAWILKINSAGDTSWTTTIRGPQSEVAESIYQTTDGGYIAVGATGAFGVADVLLIRLNSQGDSLWARTFGGPGYDWGHDVIQTPDGGYMVGGTTSTLGAGSEDVWLMKMDASGDTAWTKTYGGVETERGFSLQPVSNSGFIIGGISHTFTYGGDDGWLIRTDLNGSIIWSQNLGGSDEDWIVSVQPTLDGGYIACGFTSSFGAGNRDAWVLKIESETSGLPFENHQDMLNKYHLSQNYPNPFNPTTTIAFDLPKASEVSLKIFNILGEEVTTLVSDRLSTGSYSYEWDASNIASGVYLYRLKAGDYVETRKMVLMR